MPVARRAPQLSVGAAASVGVAGAVGVESEEAGLVGSERALAADLRTRSSRALAPEACGAHGGAEFPGFGLLLARDCESKADQWR
jgi:hypothetical protein